MIVFLQDQFIAEERAMVSIFDRCFRYGDGLFEAVLARNGQLFRWREHLARLECSARFLKLALPCSSTDLLEAAQRLLALNEMPDAVLRIQLSRGRGPRGYAPSGDEKPLIVMSLHPAPRRESLRSERWKLTVSSSRVAVGDPIANHKTCCRLAQVLAAAEARERGADEALLLNTNGEVTEGSTSNVFWIQNGTVCTPELPAGVLPGITRAAVLELCDALDIRRVERTCPSEELISSEGVFLSFTSRGIVEADSLDGRPLRHSPVTGRLQNQFEALLERECAAG